MPPTRVLTKPKQPSNLSSDDLANLRTSGLNDATIIANGLYTSRDALVIPYRDANGKLDGFTRYRPHNPKPGPNGKIPKYLQAGGSDKRAYFPAECIDRFADESLPLLFVEGEKKALCAAQYGHAAVGLGGCWMGCEGDDLIPDIANLPLTGRVSLVAFDYDPKPAAKQSVSAASIRFCRALRSRGADVRVIQIPPGPNGAKNGVDDFIVANGPDALAELVRRVMDRAEGIDAMDLKSEEPMEAPESLSVLGQPGYLLKGMSNIVAGDPKAGKTTLLYSCMADWLAAGETILYLTEEPRLVWQHRLNTHDIINHRGLRLIFGMGMTAEEILGIIRRSTETIVMADTLRTLGGVGEEENSNSGVYRAIAPWIIACREGNKTFIGVAHSRKSGGKHGAAVSGAHSLVGAVEMVVEIERGKKDNERKIKAMSRLGSPPDLVYERLDDESLEVKEQVDIMIGKKNPDAYLKLPTEPPGMTADEFAAATKMTKANALFILKSHQVIHTGKGAKGDPKRYYRRAE